MRLPFRESALSWRETNYVCIKKLGEGGASSVFMMLATNGAFRGESFAVKFYDARSDERRLAFMREIHFLRTCSHPSIIRVFDEGLYENEFPFVVMELMQGNLKELVKRRTLNDRQKFSVVTQLLSALSYLTRLDPPGVHRDIKPQNILFQGTNCVLGDFGLVFLRHSETKPDEWESPEGIPMARNYRTPELVKYVRDGTPLPPASDVFQLGLVAAELFTGTNPLNLRGGTRLVELNPIGDIPGIFSSSIRARLMEMLDMDTERRISARNALERWQELLLASYEPVH